MAAVAAGQLDAAAAAEATAAAAHAAAQQAAAEAGSSDIDLAHLHGRVSLLQADPGSPARLPAPPPQRITFSEIEPADDAPRVHMAVDSPQRLPPLDVQAAGRPPPPLPPPQPLHHSQQHVRCCWTCHWHMRLSAHVLASWAALFQRIHILHICPGGAMSRCTSLTWCCILLLQAEQHQWRHSLPPPPSPPVSEAGSRSSRLSSFSLFGSAARGVREGIRRLSTDGGAFSSHNQGATSNPEP